MQSHIFYNKAISCVECGKFLSWCNIDYLTLCNNCRVHSFKMDRLPKIINQMKKAQTGIKGEKE